MKPVKPKKLPRWLESDMKTYADRKRDLVLTPDCINLVLAALEYERQRADEAEQEARHWRNMANTLPRIPQDSVRAVQAEGRKAAKRHA